MSSLDTLAGFRKDGTPFEIEIRGSDLAGGPGAAFGFSAKIGCWS